MKVYFEFPDKEKYPDLILAGETKLTEQEVRERITIKKIPAEIKEIDGEIAVIL